MNRLMRVGLLLIAVLAMGGCLRRTNVTFPRHAPVQAERQYPAAVTVVLPEDYEFLKEEWQLGGWDDLRRWYVMYGQALHADLEARLRGIFANVAVVDAVVYAKENGLPPPPPRILTEKEAKEKAKRDRQTMGDSALTDFAPAIVGDDHGYVLFVEELEYAIIDGRAYYQLKVRFEDRFTDEVLIEGRFRAGGEPIRRREASENIVNELQQTTRSALGVMFRDLRERIEDAIEKRP